MVDTTPTATPRQALSIGRPVDVWCSFDHDWHSGFRIHQVETSSQGVVFKLARADGTLLPAPVDASRVRATD